MLSNKYRQKMEFICSRISKNQEVKLEEMIWAEKLGKANRSAGEMLRKARRHSATANTPEDSLDSFLNNMDLGDPNPNNHSNGFGSAEEIIDFFSQEKTEDWRQHD